mmetsp:Transcript_39569/g.86358  ORF Transcript_39569/g.86358 Transcript_39569/m.86358 type:complete len:233 (+) Transcript_39569:913-1611(+)
MLHHRTPSGGCLHRIRHTESTPLALYRLALDILDVPLPICHALQGFRRRHGTFAGLHLQIPAFSARHNAGVPKLGLTGFAFDAVGHQPSDHVRLRCATILTAARGELDPPALHAGDLLVLIHLAGAGGLPADFPPLRRLDLRTLRTVVLAGCHEIPRITLHIDGNDAIGVPFITVVDQVVGCQRGGCAALLRAGRGQEHAFGQRRPGGVCGAGGGTSALVPGAANDRALSAE